MLNSQFNVAMTEEQEEEIQKEFTADDEDLVNVEGTKVKLSGKLLKVYISFFRPFIVFRDSNTVLKSEYRYLKSVISRSRYYK